MLAFNCVLFLCNVLFQERDEDAIVGKRQLQKMVDFAIFREFPHCKSPLEFLKCSSERIATLTANWIRVGFCQGNFNSDNCLVSTSRSEWGESGHEEVETREWDHVDGQLSQVSVQLTWESE